MHYQFLNYYSLHSFSVKTWIFMLKQPWYLNLACAKLDETQVKLDDTKAELDETRVKWNETEAQLHDTRALLEEASQSKLFELQAREKKVEYR